MSNRENSILSIFALFLAFMVFLLLVTSTVPMPKYRALEARVKTLEAQMQMVNKVPPAPKEDEPSKYDIIVHNREMEFEARFEESLEAHDASFHVVHEFIDGKEW